MSALGVGVAIASSYVPTADWRRAWQDLDGFTGSDQLLDGSAAAADFASPPADR